jgi:hypothetical protein
VEAEILAFAASSDLLTLGCRKLPFFFNANRFSWKFNRSYNLVSDSARIYQR